MQNNNIFFPSIDIPQCENCRECCRSIPTCIAGFNTLKAIQNGEIPISIGKQFVIYRVKDEDLDHAAAKWWHFPNQNLLRSITKNDTMNKNKEEEEEEEEEEISTTWDFLAILKSREKCILLDHNGCMVPYAKPFNCAVFPYHLNHNQLKIANWCKIAKKEEHNITSEELEKITQYYEEFCFNNKSNYYNLLNSLREEFIWPIYIYKAI
jgi:hypothetical protein